MLFAFIVGVSAKAFLPVSADKNKRKESIAILSGDAYFQDLLRSRNLFTNRNFTLF